MKHHGAVKTSRPPARSSRSFTDQLPSSSITNPVPRSSDSFWNQYQALFNKRNTEPADEPTPNSSVQSHMSPRVCEGADGKSSEGS